ncbi:hypothetical protein Tco_1261780, partial [Tanacetum coccineum]
AFELMKKQEETRETRQMEFSAKLVEFKAMRAYARNWAEIGVGLGVEMGVEMGAFGKFCKALEEAAFRPVLHHYDGSKVVLNS